MKQHITMNFYNRLASVLLLALVACNNTTPKDISNEHTWEPVEKKLHKECYINNGRNEMLASVALEGDESIVNIKQKYYFGELKSQEKRKYYDDKDQIAYTVKYSEGGFKLRNSKEQLLWKVKVEQDYLKIADNEEMKGYYRIAWTATNVIKIKKEEKELVSLRLKADGYTINIEDRYILNNLSNSLSAGVLWIDQIPEVERLFICAELIRLSK